MDLQGSNGNDEPMVEELEPEEEEPSVMIKSASVVNVEGIIDEVVLMPSDDPVIWNENVCKLFVKEKTPSPSIARSVRTHYDNNFNQNCSPEVIDQSGPDGHEAELLKGLNILRQQGTLIDVTLWAEKQPHYAHRSVLSACSEYFRAMFTKPMKEKSQNDIDLIGVSSSALSAILDYIYTCKITVSLANVQSLLEAATHLQIERIVGICSLYLETQIDLDNCADIATLADNFNLSNLKSSAFKVISKNLSKLENLVITEFSLEQMNELLSVQYPVDVSEFELLNYVLKWVSFNGDKKGKALNLLKSIRWNEIRYDDLVALMTTETRLKASLVAHVIALKSDDGSTKVTMNAGLKNSRGLESALVMVCFYCFFSVVITSICI